MPKRFFRLLAVLLFALIIPVQGMAAVSAGQCMAFGHHQDGAGEENHGHAQEAVDAHDHAAHSQDDGGPMQAGDSGKNSHCGPCTACCASASIPGPAGLAIPAVLSGTKYSFAQLPPPGVQPREFDRPPLAL